MNHGAEADTADQFAAAHKALRADPSIQFNLTRPPSEPKTPPWLKAFLEWLGDLFEPVGKFLKWVDSFMPDAPVARFFLWAVLAIAGAALLWAIFQKLRNGRWRLPSVRRAPVLQHEPDQAWAPEILPVREWLREADDLARQGRFAEAIHHLLIRSIEDIARKQPDLVQPALTSREIGATGAIPTRARDLFVGLVRLVESSLFGGQAVNHGAWTEARAAYADFAQSRSWHT